MLEPIPPVDSYSTADAVINDIADLFTTTDRTVDYPEEGHFRLRGYFHIDLAEQYDLLRKRFEAHGFTPLIRKGEDGEPIILGLPTVFEKKPNRWQINLVLFILTILSTLFVGYQQSPSYDPSLPIWQTIWLGWPFSVSMLLILGAHELGHYFAARYHNVDATLPFFIPFPTIIGTMGAVIIQREPPRNRRVLLDVGAAGPLFGLIFAIPILFIGLATSDVGPLPTGGYLLEGNSLLYALAKIITFGQFVPAGGIDVSLNQVAWAGWAGLLVTAINLMPVGQLDGGHMVYVLFGERAKLLLWPTIVVLGIISLFFDGGWWMWMALLWFFGRNSATMLDEYTPLDPRRRFIAILCLILFFILFVPAPITLVGL